MQIELLGPLRVLTAEGTEVPVPGVRLRRLLAELALRSPRPVSTGLLEDLLWPEEGSTGSGALQSLVSRLRRTLGEEAKVTAGPAGYALSGVAVDVAEVETLLAQGHSATDPARGDELLDSALGRWRGEPVELAGSPDATRLEEARLQGLADRAQARIALGRLDGLDAELEELVQAHPLREQFAVLRVRALVAAGRHGEALAAYEHTRTILADELGADPSAALREAHRAALAEPAEPPRASTVPVALTSFVGRDADVTRLEELLDTSRCVTVVGPGGAGKTRLSAEVSSTRPEVVHFVQLAPVADGNDLLGVVAGVVGTRDSGFEQRRTRGEDDQRTRVVAALGRRATLMVLDNCEHLVDDVAYLVEDLLQACPGLTVLGTSREALGIEGEVLHPLGPLRGEAAVRLFSERAAAVSPGFSVGPENSEVVSAIVTRLDGLPLALELAAARLRTMTPQDLLERLSDRFRVLTGGRRTAVARHRTLRAVVDWSWELLEPDERTLLQRLSVFHAPVSVEAAAAVAPDLGDEVVVADLLGSLTEKSLVQLRPGSIARYALLETIKEYGTERLADSGELDKVVAARAHWASGVVDRAAVGLRGAAQLDWSARLDAEAEDLLAALRDLVAAGRSAEALRLAIPVCMWWTALGRHTAVREWMALARSGNGSGTAELIAEALEIVNSLMDGNAETDQVVARMRELHVELAGVPVGERGPLTFLLSVFLERFTTGTPGEFDRMIEDERVAEFLRSAGDDPFYRALIDIMCAAGAENGGDIATMERYAASALEGFASIGESLGRAGALRLIAQGQLFAGDLDRAEENYRTAGELTSKLGNADDEIQMRMRLVDVLQRRGRFEEAAEQLDRMEVVAGATSATTRSWLVLTQVGLLRQAGRTAQARELVERQMDAMFDRRGGGVWGHERAALQTALAQVRIDAGGFDVARDGLGETVDLAIATHDMPIVALTAVVVAQLVLAVGRPATAARVLGFAASLRGSDDFTEPQIAALHAGLGGRHDDEYAAGKLVPRDEALDELRSLVQARRL